MMALEITELLRRVREGDSDSLDQVFEKLYPELKRLASARLRAARPGTTVTPTILVHEVYLRMVGSQRLELEGRRHFFACAARAMRQVLVDRARRAQASKRGGDVFRITWSEDLPQVNEAPDQVLALDRAMNELAEVNPRARQVVDLRFFAGLTAADTAELLGISLRTANREWERARAFLQVQIGSP